MLKEDSPSAPEDPAQNFKVHAKESVVLQPQTPVMTALVCVGGFLVPGLGHLVLKRWVRGAIILVAVLLMFVIGLWMDGNLYRPPASGQWISFNTLGCFANVGVGIPYIYAVQQGLGVGIPTSQTFDYGWAYLIVAGLLNYLVVLDAFDIAQGRKP
jgi:hypothetical protein